MPLEIRRGFEEWDPAYTYARGRWDARHKFAGVTDVQDKLVPGTTPFLDARAGDNPGRRDMIDQAFQTNLEMGNPSNVDAGMTLPILSNTPGFSRAKTDSMGGIQATQDNT